MARVARTEDERQFDEAIGRRIEQLRKRRKMSCAALARSVGMTQGRLWFVETGARCPLFLLQKIAAALGTEVSRLL